MLSCMDIAALAIAFALWRFLVYSHAGALDDIRGPPGAELLEGHVNALFDIKDGLTYAERLLDEYGGVVKVKGLMGANQLWVSDPRAFEHMFFKASGAWDASSMFLNGVYLLFGPGLLASSGAQHQKQRRLLNPAFAAPQISTVVPIFYNIGRQLRHKLLEEIGTGNLEIDLLNWMGRTTMDFVGQGALGYHFQALEGLQNEFRDLLRLLVPTMARTGVLEDLAPIFSKIGPTWFRQLIVDLTPIPAVQELKHILNVLHQHSTVIFQERKQGLDRNDCVTEDKDILSRLVRANSDFAAEDRLSDQEAIAQFSTLMFAANDTTTSALCRVFQLLATHPKIQTKLRNELEHANADMDMEYDQLMSLPYLGAVCKETLRLHPPIPAVARVSQKDDILPLWQPIITKSGRIVTEIYVPKGTLAWVGISTGNRSKAIWGENAREWVPERWLTPGRVGKARLPGAYPSMMTFLAGERGCIGYRMAVLELKIVLSILIPAFQFEPSSKPIVWRLGATVAPFVQGRDGKPDKGPEMPIRLSHKELGQRVF